MSKYHELLGVEKNASKEVIKSAFRQKAMQCHPDRNKSPNAEAEFIEIHKAYEIISNGKAPKPTARTKAQARPQRPTVDPKEKYRNVYSAPTDPYEYKLWRQVAEERAREQARMNYQQFKNYNEAFRKSNMYPFYQAAFYFLIVFIWTLVSAAVIGTLYTFIDNPVLGGVMAFITVPMLIGVYWSYPGVRSMGDMFRNR